MVLPEWLTGTVVTVVGASIPLLLSNTRVEAIFEWVGDKLGIFALKTTANSNGFTKLLAWFWNTVPHIFIGLGRGFAKRMGV